MIPFVGMPVICGRQTYYSNNINLYKTKLSSSQEFPLKRKGGGVGNFIWIEYDDQKEFQLNYVLLYSVTLFSFLPSHHCYLVNNFVGNIYIFSLLAKERREYNIYKDTCNIQDVWNVALHKINK